VGDVRVAVAEDVDEVGRQVELVAEHRPPRRRPAGEELSCVSVLPDGEVLVHRRVVAHRRVVGDAGAEVEPPPRRAPAELTRCPYTTSKSSCQTARNSSRTLL
jgi:hypothetical protein